MKNKQNTETVVVVHTYTHTDNFIEKEKRRNNIYENKGYLPKFKKANIKGITLISLVVTIVVLLILAGITLNLLLGENGIIRKVKDAKNKYEIAEEKEWIDLAVVALKINNSEINESNLQAEIQKTSNQENLVIEEDDEYKIVYERSPDRYYVINSEGTIIIEGVVGEIRLAINRISGPFIDEALLILQIDLSELGEIIKYKYYDSYEEFATERLEDATETEIEQIFIDSENYYKDKEFTTITEIFKYWVEIGEEYREYENLQDFADECQYDSINEMLIDCISVNDVKQEYTKI